MPAPIGSTPPGNLINTLLTLAGANNVPRLTAGIARIINANRDAFTSNPELLRNVVNALPPAAREMVLNIASQLLNPPPPFPPGINIAGVNGARLPAGVTPLDNEAQILGMAGRTFALTEQQALQMISNTLQQQGARGASAARQGAALAKGMWGDNFFSTMELGAVFMYAQTLPPGQKEEFQQAFMQQFVQEVQSRYNPQQQKYIMTQFIRTAANINWANPNTPAGFKEFLRTLGDTLANGLQPFRDMMNQVRADGQPRVLQTYDIPSERGTYGAAFLYAYRDQHGQVRIGVFRHVEAPRQNLWNFNFPIRFGQAPQPGGQVQPFQPNPGWGNWPQIPNWNLPPVVPPGGMGPGPGMPIPPGMAPPTPGTPNPGAPGPIWPFPGGPGGVPGWNPPSVPGVGAPGSTAPSPLPLIRLPNMNPGDGRFAALAGQNFEYRVGNDPTAPAVRPGTPNGGITINPDGTYTVNAGVPNGTRVTIINRTTGQQYSTTVEPNVNANNSIRPGSTQNNPELRGTPFRASINGGQSLPANNNPREHGIIVRPNGDITVPAGVPIGTRITIQTDSGQTVTRVVEPDINTTDLGGGASANLDSRLAVQPALNLKVKLFGDSNPPRNLTNEWVDLGNGFRVRRGPDGEVQFGRTGAPIDPTSPPIEFTTDGGQSAIVHLDTTIPSIADQTVGDVAQTGRLALPQGVRVTGIRLEQADLAGGNVADPAGTFRDVHLGNTEFSPYSHPSSFTISHDGHFDTTAMGGSNAVFIVRTSDGREFRVTTNNPGGIPL